MKAIKFIVYSLALLAAGVYVSHAFLSAAAEEEAKRAAAYAERRYERQLDKCQAGNFCKVEGYRFLTIAERRLP